MIQNTDRFNKVLSDLLAYYHKPCNETVFSVWLQTCNESLTDEEFYQCVALCLRERVQLPAIDEFIQLLQGDSKALEEMATADAWRLILEGCAIASSTREEHVARKQEIMASLSPSQTKALYELGGFSRLGQVAVDDMTWRRKEFFQLCKVYQDGDKAQGRSDRYFKAIFPYNALTGEAKAALPPSSNGNGLTKIGDSMF